MAPGSGRAVTSDLVDELLALPTREQQAAFLRARGLLDAGGMDRLLDFADDLLGEDPGRALRLAEACAELAGVADAPAATPRANYVRAGAHHLNGEFDQDLRFTNEAYGGYLVLGMNLEALRTHVGKMAALINLGLYQESLDTGQTVLDALAGSGQLEVAPSREQADLLIALVRQNQGICYEYMGRYEETLGVYGAAEARYRALGMTEKLGEILDNRGAVLLLLGRGKEALAAHEAAAAVFSDAALTHPRAKAIQNIGEANLRLADYRRSLEAFEQGRRLYESIGALADESLLLLDMANAYLELNLYSEALAAYEEAHGMLRGTGMVHDRARALWGMGSTFIVLSQLDEAEKALAEAAELFAAADNAPLLSGVMLEQASCQAALGDRAAAQTTAEEALALVSDKDRPLQLVYAHLGVADLLSDNLAAEEHLQEARRLAERLALPHLRYRSNERLGRLRRLQGHHEEARALLEDAVKEIEGLRGTVDHETARTFFLRDKTVAYEELLKLHLSGEIGTPRSAFAVAERAKSRALVDLLAGVTSGPVAPPDDPLERRVQDLRSDLNATYSQLLGNVAGESASPLPDLRGRAVELEKEISRLRLRASATSDPSLPASPSDPRYDLPEDVTLLAYHVVGDEIVAFVKTYTDVRVVRGCGSISKVAPLLRQLEVQWDRMGAGQEFVRQHADLLERLARQVLASLHDELISPLAPHLDQAAERGAGQNGAPRKLVIVPHGLLHQVPLHALFDGERYLLERFEVSYAPSATAFTLFEERAARDPNRALAMSVADSSIPAVTDEARAVARHFPSAEVLDGQRATLDALRAEVSGYDVVHLACHGMFRADNPMFSALKLHDGWLIAADAMALDLPGALVTLSACESGRGEVIGGDEILGLPRAFLGAGAATLLVSLWLVQDETTAELMEEWYGRLRGGTGRAAALRAAQLEIKERHPHPYYWAPFVLIGQR